MNRPLKGVFLDVQTMGQDLDWQSFNNLTPTIQWHHYETTLPNEVLERIDGASIIVTNKILLKNPQLTSHQAKSLKLICLTATGTDNIDTDCATALGITVKNVEGYATCAVVQHTIGLMITLASSLITYNRCVEKGQWHHSPMFCLNHLPSFELCGKTLGIIGFGRLGRGVALVAKALGMHVLCAESLRASRVIENHSQEEVNRNTTDFVTRVPLEFLFRNSDVLSLHCPLTEQTHHIINKESLSWMKPQAVLINTARGGLIDEAALLWALNNQRISGAALDTLTQEPPSENHPFFPLPPNLILTPHSAWSPLETRQRLLDLVAKNIEEYIYAYK